MTQVQRSPDKGMQIRRGASSSPDPVEAVAELRAGMYQEDASFALFYCSPNYDLDALGAELAKAFEGVPLIGCTTAGEITPTGYVEGAITGVSVRGGFTCATRRIDNLSEFEFAAGDDAAQSVLRQLETHGVRPTGGDTFGFLLIDGLSLKEEAVVSTLSRNMGDIQLFGGSAGDGTDFGATHLYHDGAFHSDCAVFTLVQTSNPFVVFKTEHFVSSEEKMVVTEADPERRIVTEINGVPAGREYARMVGLEVDKLTPLIFSTYPVVVQVGGSLYVRSIQKVNPDESLTFFCAIDEGIVLTVARGVDLVDNLKSAFDKVRDRVGPPDLVLGCDCILRHLEIQQRGIQEQVGELLVDNNVIGFATYGEQFNAMHVNQTFTGVAIGTARSSNAQAS